MGGLTRRHYCAMNEQIEREVADALKGSKHGS